MTRIVWDATGERLYETGVSNGVLYLQDNNGEYPKGVAWNGLTSVNENPTGAEPTPLYADNIKYLELMSVEEFEATVEAFTYPKEFEECDGSAEIASGVTVGQQPRRPFGLSYKTIIGNDVKYEDYGYKIHLVYGAKVSPSDKSYETINESPDAITFSWDMTTTPVPVPGMKPTSTLVLDSTKVDPDKLKMIEDILYGENETARLPLPSEILSIIGEDIEVEADEPQFDDQTGVITIPNVVGVKYKVDGNEVSSGPQDPIQQDEEVTVTAEAEPGYKLKPGTVSSWEFVWYS